MPSTTLPFEYSPVLPPTRFAIRRMWVTIIHANRSVIQPPLDMLELCDFVDGFRKKIKAEYPTSGFAPANA